MPAELPHNKTSDPEQIDFGRITTIFVTELISILLNHELALVTFFGRKRTL